MLYSYLNLESTKTSGAVNKLNKELYSYLNLESTKTVDTAETAELGCTVT